MESFFGIISGVVVGILGALFTIFAWAFAGIIREYILGCFGGYITFVIIELPVWVGLPVLMGVLLPDYVSNLAGRNVVSEVYFIAIFVLLLIKAVAKVRGYMESIMYRK